MNDSRMTPERIGALLAYALVAVAGLCVAYVVLSIVLFVGKVVMLWL